MQKKTAVRVRKGLYLMNPNLNKNKYYFSPLKGSKCKTNIFM